MAVRLLIGDVTQGDVTPGELVTVETGGDALSLIEGDNRCALQCLVAEGTRVELAYLDPPFFTQRVHQRVKRSRNERTGRMTRSHHDAFDDRWPDLASYLSALRERLALIRALLSDDGSVVIHVDPSTSHYIKVMCDELFGVSAFASEIIWRYRRWPAKTPNFQRVHDVLLRYQRNPDAKPRFQQLYEPLAASTLKTWGDKKQLADFENGQRIRSTKTSERSPGAPLGDVWDIGVIAPVAKERTGYPTQKPKALLRRVIEACSYEGDTVLDPYVGSGTTLDVAAELGRRAIGIDQSREAIEVTRARLTELGHAHSWRRFTADAPASQKRRAGASPRKPRSPRCSRG
jgi:DNA modification methylase